MLEVVADNAAHVWVMEEFDRSTGEFRIRYDLKGFSDAAAASLLRLERIPNADLFEINEAMLDIIRKRFELDVDYERYDYVIGRESA